MTALSSWNQWYLLALVLRDLSQIITYSITITIHSQYPSPKPQKRVNFTGPTRICIGENPCHECNQTSFADKELNSRRVSIPVLIKQEFSPRGVFQPGVPSSVSTKETNYHGCNPHYEFLSTRGPSSGAANQCSLRRVSITGATQRMRFFTND